MTYRFRSLPVGDYGAVGKFFGPGLPKEGVAILGARHLNIAYEEGFSAAVDYCYRIQREWMAHLAARKKRAR